MPSFLDRGAHGELAKWVSKSARAFQIVIDQLRCGNALPCEPLRFNSARSAKGGRTVVINNYADMIAPSSSPMASPRRHAAAGP